MHLKPYCSFKLLKITTFLFWVFIFSSYKILSVHYEIKIFLLLSISRYLSTASVSVEKMGTFDVIFAVKGLTLKLGEEIVKNRKLIPGKSLECC